MRQLELLTVDPSAPLPTQVRQIRNHIMTIARGSRVRDTASQTTYVSDILTAGTVQEAIDELAMQVAEADAMDGAMG
jgi:hypothetical protein